MTLTICMYCGARLWFEPDKPPLWCPECLCPNLDADLEADMAEYQRDHEAGVKQDE